MLFFVCKTKILKLDLLKNKFILLIKGVLLFWKFSYPEWTWYKKLIVRLNTLDMPIGIEGMCFKVYSSGILLGDSCSFVKS